MIFTITTVVVLVIGFLSLGLALYGGIVSSEIAEGMKGDQSSKHRSEQRYYLLGMIGIIVLGSRLLNAPIFFWMIQSLVPYCPSAMCSYGVINAGEPFSSIALVLKLILPFIYGLWIVAEVTNRKEPTLPLLVPLARSFLLVLLPLVLLDSAMDVLLVLTMRPIDVPCCSSAYDVDPPFSPSTILGPEFGMFIIMLTILLSLTLIAVQWVEQHQKTIRIIIMPLSAIVAFLYLISLHDLFAPMVLGLSTHHCPYCLFQEFPDTAIFAILFWVGVAAVGWKWFLEHIWQSRNLSMNNIQSTRVVLLKLSSIAILFSMVSFVSHLLLVL